MWVRLLMHRGCRSEELPIVPLWSRKAAVATSEALSNVEAFTANASGVQEFLAVIFPKH